MAVACCNQAGVSSPGEAHTLRVASSDKRHTPNSFTFIPFSIRGLVRGCSLLQGDAVIVLFLKCIKQVFQLAVAANREEYYAGCSKKEAALVNQDLAIPNRQSRRVLSNFSTAKGCWSFCIIQHKSLGQRNLDLVVFGPGIMEIDVIFAISR